MNKVILVLLDGLNADTGRNCMGYLQALCQDQKGRCYTLECELPSMSRPLYECVLTGIAPHISGVYHNNIVRLSREQSIFHYARQAGLKTAAAAYHWVSELYNAAPFDAGRDRHTADETLPIQYGHFYYADHYPDSHLFDDAEHLRRAYAPDFLLVHPMNIDDAGHKAGFDSAAYRNAARKADIYLSHYLQTWLDDGYQVIVTADHGMNNDKSHGGILPEEREVPLYVFGSAFSLAGADIRQTEICGTVCALLGAAHDKPLCRELLR
ncbi:alkaline phosphatase family protein [Uruburuella testudinis]|uniref:Alkaline phosphatase family protein n=1 Tax=Uruburuella testudinis TaxID=1282863 RepID=A0ABY4DSM1_9NEIS|nr:alkaline phosphatase family protein [Uruburuella testudinis]UOO80994.1 alkaline phosphatase family protein [Uruburuella testudinis]